MYIDTEAGSKNGRGELGKGVNEDVNRVTEVREEGGGVVEIRKRLDENTGV